MSGLYEFIVVFCSTSLLFGGIYMLKPSGNIGKAVKYIFALIFLCSVLGAIFNIKIDDLDNFTINSNQHIEASSLGHDALELTFEEALRSSGLIFSKITVCTNKNENGSIIISKVTVFTKEAKEKVREALGGERAEYEIEVCYE